MGFRPLTRWLRDGQFGGRVHHGRGWTKTEDDHSSPLMLGGRGDLVFSLAYSPGIGVDTDRPPTLRESWGGVGRLLRDRVLRNGMP